MKTSNKVLLSAAVAGLLGVGLAGTSAAKDKDAKMKVKKVAVFPCYGVNSCKGKSACNTAGNNNCKGMNSCKGQGMLLMPKESCTSIEGGSLTPVEKKG